MILSLVQPIYGVATDQIDLEGNGSLVEVQMLRVGRCFGVSKQGQI